MLCVAISLYVGSYVFLRGVQIYYAHYSHGSYEIKFRGFYPANNGELFLRANFTVFNTYMPLWIIDNLIVNDYNHIYHEEVHGG